MELSTFESTLEFGQVQVRTSNLAEIKGTYISTIKCEVKNIYSKYKYFCIGPIPDNNIRTILTFNSTPKSRLSQLH